MADPFTGDQLAAVYPEFLALPTLNATVSAMIANCIGDIDAGKFGTDYVPALMMLVAHWLELVQRKGRGPITSTRVGDLSTSYAALQVMRALDQTAYGMMLLRLMRRKVGGPHFVGQNYHRPGVPPGQGV